MPGSIALPIPKLHVAPTQIISPKIKFLLLNLWQAIADTTPGVYTSSVRMSEDITCRTKSA
ncbi:hypothetical protein Mapa_013964 [Marchantia paleacea]|nr:hypothetical protein Mapa_013964 [Marchantia paleacea]